jgi:acetyltransferase-like isoleucine patch superfamily enzyme
MKGWVHPHMIHGKLTQWNWLPYHPENLIIGHGVDIGAFTFLNAKQGIILEDDVQIGPHCDLISISTIDGKQGPITIRKGAKVGMGCRIMPGITIGEGAVVGACSFVSTNIPAGEMWFGQPAQFRRKL